MTEAADALASGLLLAYEDLDQSLARVEELANWLFESTTLAEPERTRQETQRAGCAVLLVGVFESFLKGVVREHLRAVPRTGRTFAQLPEKMRNLHYEGGGRVLAEVMQRQRKQEPQFFAGITANDVVERLYSPQNEASTEYYLVWEAFADTRQSPKSSTVSDILKGLGVETVWPSIEGHADDAALITDLTDLIEKRNECAHTGRMSVVPSAPEILRYAQVIRKIGSASVHLLSAALTSMVAA